MFDKVLAFFIIGALAQLGQSNIYPIAPPPVQHDSGGILKAGADAFNGKLATQEKDQRQTVTSNEWGSEHDSGKTQEDKKVRESEENNASIKSIQSGVCAGGGNIHIEQHKNKKNREEDSSKLDVRNKVTNYGKSSSSDTMSHEKGKQQEVAKQNEDLFFKIAGLNNKVPSFAPVGIPNSGRYYFGSVFPFKGNV